MNKILSSKVLRWSAVKLENHQILAMRMFFLSKSYYYYHYYYYYDMMNDIGIDKQQQRYIIKKMINIAIRATYYIFCCRNRNWDSPDFFFFLAFVLFCFCFCLFLFFFLFNNSISSSICKLPIRSEIYNCTFKNTNNFSII